MTVATFAHEAAGHGGACLIAGGRTTQLTSVYFDCSAMTGYVALGGPLGNFAAALLGWAGLRVLPQAEVRARLMALLVLAFSAFWGAGYLIYAMAKGHGDYALAAHELLALPPEVWRPAGILLGIGLYWVSIRLVGSWAGRVTGDRAATLLRTAWIAASAAAVLAAALYQPNPAGAMIQAGLEIGAASLPLLFPRRRGIGEPATPAISRSLGLIVAAIALLAVFAATLGRGVA